MKLKFIFMGIMMTALSACATKPKPMPVVENKPVQRELLPPVVVQPKIAKPVEQAPMADVVEAAPVGPQAGSSEHFKYISGEDRVYFGYNLYTLTPQARDVLRKQAQWLNEYNTAIIVIGGNADERGTREYNLALGARRADAVKSFLVAQGIASGRITTVSYGKERPIDGGSNEAAWALNRNAHSAVLVGGSS